MFKLTIHGTRGSYPVCGRPYRRHGGHTPCLSLETGRGILVLDAGSGIASLSQSLRTRRRIPPITLLLTHVHLDHVMGLAAFHPLLVPGVAITVMADSRVLGNWPRAIQTLFRNPLWPINLWRAGARIRFRSLPRNSSSIRLDGLTIAWCPVKHPQGCVSYKLTAPDRTMVLATDREHGDPQMDRKFLKFCQGADLLIHDAQYSPEEFPRKKGWGHSTWKEAARVAAQAQVGKLLLSSHDPSRSDKEIDRFVKRARKIFPRTQAAKDQMRLL